MIRAPEINFMSMHPHCPPWKSLWKPPSFLITVLIAVACFWVSHTHKSIGSVVWQASFPQISYLRDSSMFLDVLVLFSTRHFSGCVCTRASLSILPLMSMGDAPQLELLWVILWKSICRILKHIHACVHFCWVSMHIIKVLAYKAYLAKYMDI